MNTTSNGTNATFTYSSSILGCTSIVAQDLKGNVFHGRTLDWDVPNYLRNSSFIVRICT